MKILSVRFRKTKKVYPFIAKENEDYSKGDIVIIETIRGNQIGTVIHEKNIIPENLSEENLKLREVKRKLNEKEVIELEELDKKADDAYFKCKKIIKKILPEMNLVIGEYTFNEEKLIFYFTAKDRLDFRELVREVNKAFNRKVEFYQIKVVDEAKILNAFGRYGSPLFW